MIRAAAHRPIWLFVMFVIAYYAMDLLFFSVALAGSYGRVPLHELWQELFLNPHSLADQSQYKKVILVGASIGYGFFRIAFRHPDANAGYTKWLETTPWTRRMPLPLGTIELTWRDIVPFAAVYLLGRYDAQINPALPLVAFGVTYLACGTALNLHCKAVAESYPILFAFGGMLRWHANWTVILSLLAASYLVFLFGLRRSLARFPWRNTFPIVVGDDPAQALGWPFALWFLRRKAVLVTQVNGWTNAALVAWWVYCIFSFFCEGVPRSFQSQNAIIVALAMGACFGLCRVATYLRGALPPLSLMGRIFTGKILLPNFDYVFLAPIIVVFLPIALAFAGSWADVQPGVVAAVSVGASMAVALLAGPSLRKWQLTGEFRVNPRAMRVPTPATRRRIHDLSR